jgi:hypothetical protein
MYACIVYFPTFEGLHQLVFASLKVPWTSNLCLIVLVSVKNDIKFVIHAQSDLMDQSNSNAIHAFFTLY